MGEIFINYAVYDDGTWSLVTYFLLQKRIDVNVLPNTSNVRVGGALSDIFKLRTKGHFMDG